MFKQRNQRNSTTVQPLKCCNEPFEVFYSPAWSLADRATWLNQEIDWHLQSHVVPQAAAFLALIAEATE